jgi:opacity protein-like surface antigen
MKKLSWLAGFLCLVFAQSAMAQEAPRIEIFGGYSFLRATTADDAGLIIANTGGQTIDSVSANGFMVSGAYNLKYLKKRLGIVAEYSRQTKETDQFIPIAGIMPVFPNGRLEGRVQTFLFGPRYTFRTESISPFGHFLVGFSRGSFDNFTPTGVVENSGTGFSFAAGGGFDIKFTSRLSARVVQAEFIRTPIPNGTDINSGRVSTGLIFRMGSVE